MWWSVGEAYHLFGVCGDATTNLRVLNFLEKFFGRFHTFFDSRSDRRKEIMTDFLNQI